ncbi:MaoC-like dehydratase domain-containing protein [Mycoplasmoides gallisepticum]|nr:MaoC-like dehydratase domain-containing protein [Mycoplasmoides gallisepticum]
MIYAESTILSKRESKSRPIQGIVTVLTRELIKTIKKLLASKELY